MSQLRGNDIRFSLTTLLTVALPALQYPSAHNLNSTDYHVGEFLIYALRWPTRECTAGFRLGFVSWHFPVSPSDHLSSSTAVVTIVVDDLEIHLFCPSPRYRCENCSVLMCYKLVKGIGGCGSEPDDLGHVRRL